MQIPIKLLINNVAYGILAPNVLVTPSGSVGYANSLLFTDPEVKAYDGNEVITLDDGLYEYLLEKFTEQTPIQKFRPDQRRNSHGQFAPEGIGGGGSQPPYPLKNDNAGWAKGDKHTQTGYVPNIEELDGPDAPLFTSVWDGSEERKFTGGLADRAYRLAHPDVAKEDGVLEKAVLKDPRYPKPPIQITPEMLVKAGYPEGTLFENLRSEDQTSILNAGLKEMAGAEPDYWSRVKPMGIPVDKDKVAAYLAEENKVVKNILREQTFPDGKSVGFIVDDIAHQAIKQLSLEASDGTISLTMPKGRLRRFMADGEYKSGHEVPLEAKGGSTRQEYLDIRDKFEIDVLGIPQNAAKPIYAVLNRSADESTYGDIQLVLKDSVASRTSITIGDSLDGHAGGASWMPDLVKGDMSVSDFYSMYGKHAVTLFNNNNRSSKAVYHMTNMAEYPVQTGVSDSLFTWEMEPVRDATANLLPRLYSAKWGAITGYKGVKDVRTWADSGYLEAQIHGRVKLNDVAKIVVPPTFSITKAEVQSLTDAGVQVIKGDPILGKDK